jgi:hypothetical protein
MATAIVFAITCISLNRANAPSMQVLMSKKFATNVLLADEGRVVWEHAMSAPVGGAHGDGDDRSKYGIPRSTANTTDIGSATHGDGDDETNGGAKELAARKAHHSCLRWRRQ